MLMGDSHYLAALAQITKDPWIFDLIELGFKLELENVPTQNRQVASGLLTTEQKNLCDQEVLSLVQKGAIAVSDAPGFFSPIFVIPKKSECFRPIINLKKLKTCQG